MIVAAIKASILRLWPVALSVTFVTSLGLFLRGGDVDVHIVLLIAAVTLLAMIIVRAPLEYQKMRYYK